MSKINIQRLLELPANLTPSTIYIIKGPGLTEAQMYFTNNDGTEIRHLLNKSDVTQLIASATGGLSPSIQIVGTIAERDALNLVISTMVLVLNAVGDPTVTRGSAVYAYNAVDGTYTKTSEAESFDFTINWNNIVGRPVSTSEAIDLAAQSAHSHANMPVLDLLSEDPRGDLTFKGTIIKPVVEISDW